jgi:hypothetical protein
MSRKDFRCVYSAVSMSVDTYIALRPIATISNLRRRSV